MEQEALVGILQAESAGRGGVSINIEFNGCFSAGEGAWDPMDHEEDIPWQPFPYYVSHFTKTYGKHHITFPLCNEATTVVASLHRGEVMWSFGNFFVLALLHRSNVP